MALIFPVVPTLEQLRISLWYHPMILKSLSVVAACGTSSYRKTARCTMMRASSIPCHHRFALKSLRLPRGASKGELLLL